MVKRHSSRRIKRGPSLFGGVFRWGLVLALAIVVGLLSLYLVRDYKSTFSILELVELVGEPSEEGITLRVGDENVAEEFLGKLRRLERGSFDVMTIEDIRRLPESIRGIITLGDSRYPFALLWGKEAMERNLPRLAIIIDDAGSDLAVARKFTNLPVATTLSILPHLRRSRDIAGELGERSIPFMLHLPMQPKGYPDKDPGPHALMSGMSGETVINTLDSALASAKGAVGINNHMGSAATEDLELMTLLMEEINGRGLFFIDSLTTNHSKATKAAGEAGVLWGVRDIFLDNVKEEAAIIENLEKAAALAKKRGSAIVIGHIYQETLSALKRWHLEGGTAGIEVVYVDELL